MSLVQHILLCAINMTNKSKLKKKSLMKINLRNNV